MGSLYGKGTYFAINAEQSDSYTNQDTNGHSYLFYARVLSGIYTNGQNGMIGPPNVGRDGTDKYDSTVDDDQDPTIFVIYKDTQAYPDYLVTYN